MQNIKISIKNVQKLFLHLLHLHKNIVLKNKKTKAENRNTRFETWITENLPNLRAQEPLY